MILQLVGHDYKYAVEQTMLTLFPGERPVYGTASPEALSAVVSLHESRVYASAHTRLFLDSGLWDGRARVRLDALTDEISATRLLSRAVKQSFYRAAVAAAGEQPPWGSLSGVRPGKLVTPLLLAGGTRRRAASLLEREYFVSRPRAELCAETAQVAADVKRSLAGNDCCLYVGIPFCPTRCAYCSFVSNSVEKSAALVEPYFRALEREIRAVAGKMAEGSLRVRAVYIGGGTPTTLSAEQLRELMDLLTGSFDLSRCGEFTVEAGRPDTVTEEKLRAIRDGGATRISINPQTTSAEVLRAIGRRHSPEETMRAYELARRLDVGEINMDLIAGLPADSAEGFIRSLETVMALEPENITVHTLALKKGSAITLGAIPIPGREQVARMLDAALERLPENGYRPYYLYRQKFMSGGFENVGWTRPGKENLYNVCVMEELCSVIALGGGGSTKLVTPGSGRMTRIFNPKYPQEYVERIDDVIAKKAILAEL